MATNAIAGYKGFVYAGPSTGTAIKIAELRNFTITYTMSEIDATSHDSSGHREVIGGVDQWEATAEYLYASTSSQTQLYSALVNKTLSSFNFYPQGTSSGFPIYTGTGYVNSWSGTGSNDDAHANDIGIVGTGVLTQSTSS